MLLQLAVNGLALGAAYALVALGFVLVLKATSAVNFAQGDLVMAGGYAGVALAALVPVEGLALPGLVLLPLVLALMAAFGLVFSALAYFPLRRRPPVSVFISTIAFGIILQNGANVLFGPAQRAAPPLVGSGTFSLGELVVSRQSAAIIVVTAALIVGLQLLFARTQFGRRLRATAEDPEMARVVGVNVRTMIGLTFALATALAGAAGLLLANQYFVEPGAGLDLMVMAYIAVVVGGWGSIPGAVAGALIIAIFQVIVAAWISSPAAEAALYAAVLLVLFLRPQGLVGEAAGRRA